MENFSAGQDAFDKITDEVFERAIDDAIKEAGIE